jgi:hypothetical protein
MSLGGSYLIGHLEGELAGGGDDHELAGGGERGIVSSLEALEEREEVGQRLATPRLGVQQRAVPPVCVRDGNRGGLSA